MYPKYCQNTSELILKRATNPTVSFGVSCSNIGGGDYKKRGDGNSE